MRSCAKSYGKRKQFTKEGKKETKEKEIVYTKKTRFAARFFMFYLLAFLAC